MWLPVDVYGRLSDDGAAYPRTGRLAVVGEGQAEAAGLSEALHPEMMGLGQVCTFCQYDLNLLQRVASSRPRKSHDRVVELPFKC
jgi:hypothetical protein